MKFLSALIGMGRNGDDRRGIAHFDRGEFEPAAECFERALVRHEDAVRDRSLLRRYAGLARGYLGLQRFHLGDDPRSEQEITLALDMSPAWPDLRYCRARIRERSGRVREALDDLERVIRDQPRHVDARLLRALCLSQTGNLRSAEQSLQHALALGWASPRGLMPALAEGEPLAIPGLECAVREEPGFADRRVRLAEALLEAGRLRDALGEVDQALRLNPRYLEARVLAARACVELGDAPGACSVLEAALEHAPGFPDLHFWLGLARFCAMDFERAATALESAVALNREFGRAQRLLGLCYHALGQGPLALRALRRGMSRDRGLERIAKGAPPAGLAGGRPVEAGLARAVALQPDYPDLHLALARTRAARGDIEGARDASRRALALAPGYDAAALELAQAELALGAPAAAQAVLEPLALRRPGWADVHALLGRARLLEGDGVMAEAALRAAVLLNPGYAAARADLGWALLTQGRSMEADLEFARALELDPLNALPRRQLEWREQVTTRRGAA